MVVFNRGNKKFNALSTRKGDLIVLEGEGGSSRRNQIIDQSEGEAIVTDMLMIGNGTLIIVIKSKRYVLRFIHAPSLSKQSIIHCICDGNKEILDIAIENTLSSKVSLMILYKGGDIQLLEAKEESNHSCRASLMIKTGIYNAFKILWVYQTLWIITKYKVYGMNTSGPNSFNSLYTLDIDKYSYITDIMM